MDRDHPSPEPGTATESGSSRRCPYCRTTFERDDPILTCASCNAVHHGECWEENGGCAVWGCESRPAPGQPSSSSESESESDPLPHVKVRTVIEPDDVDPPLGASQPRDNRRTEPERLEALDRVDRFLVAGIRSGDFSASRQALRRLAAKLEIPGRSSMNKDELFGEILTATSGDSSGAAELVAGMNRRELDQVAASLEIAGRSGMTRSQLINAVRRGIAESSLTWKHHSPSPDDARSRHSGGVLDGESGGTAFFAVAVFGILLGLIVAFVILGIQGKLW